ncbi:MAG TPA: DNA translocase FtsK 4TM domain-containing protein, partial [Chloroflexota bacterium]|nr:DNA translocase FtsK 4TM domain-containing protein [Chloroflexota bacterium]
MTLATRRAPAEPEEENVESEIPADHHLRDGLVLLGTALIIGLALLAPAEDGGADLRAAFGYAFGWAKFLVPIVIGAFAVANLRTRFDAEYLLSPSETLGWSTLFVSLDIILQVIDGNPATEWGTTRGGGIVGQLVWTALVNALGVPSAAALLVIFLLTAIALLFDLTVDDLLHALRLAAQAVAGRFRDLLVWLQHRPARINAANEAMGKVRSEAVETGAKTLAITSAVADGSLLRQWQLPPITLLKSGSLGELSQIELARKTKLIEDTLADFDVYARVV